MSEEVSDVGDVDGLPEPLHYPTNPDSIRMERRQLRDEGRVVAPLAEEFEALIDGAGERDDAYDRRAKDLYARTHDLDAREDYPYTEPSTLEGIRAERPDGGPSLGGSLAEADVREAVHGGWFGACAGCLLGKPVQGWVRSDITGFLAASDQSPPAGYLHDRVSEEVAEEFGIYENVENRGRENSLYIDDLEHMPLDDDIDYIVVGLGVLEAHGHGFEPVDVANYWLSNIPLFNTYTAERAAYVNFCDRVTPPESATRRNPFREHVGAMIRADTWAYVALGDPGRAAELAFRDASISHTKNGIYGETWAAAMIAAAPIADGPREILRAGLAEIPANSRLAEAVEDVIGWYDEGMDYEAAVERIHDRWDEADLFDWVHTIPNAQVVTLALLYGEGEFGRTIGRAITAGFDTDSHGATVGSVLGAHLGVEAIPDQWIDPLNDTVRTSLVEYGTESITGLADATVAHWRPE